MTAAASDWDGDTRTRRCGSNLQSAAAMAIPIPVSEKRYFDDDNASWFGNGSAKPSPDSHLEPSSSSRDRRRLKTTPRKTKEEGQKGVEVPIDDDYNGESDSRTSTRPLPPCRPMRER